MRRFGRRLLAARTGSPRRDRNVLVSLDEAGTAPVDSRVRSSRVLLVLGTPFLGVKWGFPDDRVLANPRHHDRSATTLRTDFAVNSLTTLMVVIPDVIDLPPAEIDRYARQLSQVADVESVSAPGGTFASGVRVGPPMAPTGLEGRQRILHRQHRRTAVLGRFGEPTGPAARRGHARRARRAADRTRTDQQGQRRGVARHDALGVVADRRDHVRLALPAHRQRGTAAEGPVSTCCR